MIPRDGGDRLDVLWEILGHGSFSEFKEADMSMLVIQYYSSIINHLLLFIIHYHS